MTTWAAQSGRVSERERSSIPSGLSLDQTAWLKVFEEDELQDTVSHLA